MQRQNLKGIEVSKELHAEVTTLANAAGDDPYLISIPLLISAYLGKKSLSYFCLEERMVAALEHARHDQKMTDRLPWLFGRLLLANSLMGKASTDSYARYRIQELLKENGKNQYSAWARGYLAATHEKIYSAEKDKMKQAAISLTKKMDYKPESKYESKEAYEKAQSGMRANALWAWVLAVYAAANANDSDMYQFALEQIRHIGKQKSIAAVISNNLLSKNSDFPAWALATIQLAAVTHKDYVLYDQLQIPLTNTINAEKLSGDRSDVALATVISELAVHRYESTLGLSIGDEAMADSVFACKI